jgi:hypothetical protein
MSSFRLGYENDANAWCFTLRTTDTAAAGSQRACGPPLPKSDGVEDPGDTLAPSYHLLGVYDAAAAEIRMYVDNEPVVPVNVTFTPWQASGQFIVGRNLYTPSNNGAKVLDSFDGQIGHVQVWQGALSDRQARDITGAKAVDQVAQQ